MHYTKEGFLTDFFLLLNQNNIKYFVRGEYDFLPQNTGDSDLDMLITEPDKKKFQLLLANLISSMGITIATYYYNYYTLFYRLLYTDNEIYWGLQIDILFKGFYYHNVPYYPIEKVMSNIIIHNGIKVLNIKKEYYIGFLKEISHVGKVKEKFVIGFLKELDTNEYYYQQELTQLYGQTFCNLVFQNRKSEKLQKIFPQLHKEIISSIYKRDKIKWIQDRLSMICRFFGKKPGYVIAILGTDGSGKSTIINTITPILNETFHHGIIYEHLRPNVLPDIGILLRKKEKCNGAVTNPHAQKQSKPFVSILRWSYYMIDYTFGYLKKIFPVIHLKSKVFLFDRYYYDYYIDQKRLRTNIPQCIIRIGDFFVPEPDLILCLGGDPDVIYNRKPETSIAEVNRQINELKSFCVKRKNAVWIDTSVAIQDSVVQAMNAISSMMRNRRNPL
jgi:thymidylate kinase